MMKRSAIPFLILCAIGLIALTPGAGWAQASIAMHADVVSKAPCTMDSPVTRQLTCDSYNRHWPVHTGAHVYLMVTDVPESTGVELLTVGINYCAPAGVGADVFDWTSCATYDYPLAGPNGAWPASGSVNRLAWDECQTTEIPPRGIHALAGVFYVYAYDSDLFRVGRGATGSTDPIPSYTNCDGNIFGGNECWLAVIGFSGVEPVCGYNGCAHWDFPPPYFLSPGCLMFEEVVVGTRKDRQIDYQACSSDSELDITIEGEGFSIVSGGGPQSLPGGHVAEVVVRFEPTAEGEHTGTLHFGIEHFTLGEVTACLTGTGDSGVAVRPTSWGRLKQLFQK